MNDRGISIPEFLALLRSAGFSPYVIGNRYKVNVYLEPTAARPEPPTGEDFVHQDILFRRE